MSCEWYQYVETSFERMYMCCSPSSNDKAHIESGDKIIMPPSALDRLTSLCIDHPMLFEVRKNFTKKRASSHCGVLEFTAEEGFIIMPTWMMENLLLQEGDLVRVKDATLQKGKYVKLQPHSVDFLGISDPKAMLETALRQFTCLTTGDTIVVPYNDKKYYIDIIETKPCNAICIIDTDCEVDFAPPLDYKEPERPVLPGPTGERPYKRRAQGKVVFGSNVKQTEIVKETSKEEASKDEGMKFKAFTGKSYTLMG